MKNRAPSLDELAKWRMAYQFSPIILTGGIAGDGGSIPIINLTNKDLGSFQASTNGVVTGSLTETHGAPDQIFASYEPIPGSTLIDNQVATYPFANQAIAGNAVVAQPLHISMMMLCPARGAPEGQTNTGYPFKQTTMINLQSKLAQHNSQGGLYSVVTPAYIYTNCIMTAMRDISGVETHQVQYRWQLDFIQPLVTLESAQAVFASMNATMRQITNGVPPVGAPTGVGGLPITNPTQNMNTLPTIK